MANEVFQQPSFAAHRPAAALGENGPVVSHILEKDPGQVDYVENGDEKAALDLARESGDKGVRAAFERAGWELK